MMKTLEFLWPLSWGDWITDCADTLNVSEQVLEDMIVEEVEVDSRTLGVTLSARNRPGASEQLLYDILDWAEDQGLDTGYTS